jgi:hypothetical protein
MAMPNDTATIRNQALDRAWALAEQAQRDLGAGSWEQAEATAAVASAWAAVSQAAAARQLARKP